MADNMSLPALLWDTIPEDAENHPDYMAIQSLMYQESTSIEQAENFKDQGNQRLKMALKTKNKLFFHEAIKYYTKGIDVQLDTADGHLKSVLCSNRAQAEIHLNNWRKALNDSVEALRWDPSNAKACYRGARAALRLDEVTTALKLCHDGLKAEPENEALLAAQQEAARRDAIIRLEQTRISSEKEKRFHEASVLLAAFARREIKLCQSNFKIGNLKPFVDEGDILHWPVLFVYPETMQQDIIQDVSETDLLSELLDVMFSPNAEPLQWDNANIYRRDTVDVYYLANAGLPFSQKETLEVLTGEYRGDPEVHAPQLYGDKSAFFFRVDGNQSIHDVLSSADYIVPGLPTFFIVARGSNYHLRFLESVSGGR